MTLSRLLWQFFCPKIEPRAALNQIEEAVITWLRYSGSGVILAHSDRDSGCLLAHTTDVITT